MCVQCTFFDQESIPDLVEKRSVQTRFSGPETEVQIVLRKCLGFAESGFGNIRYIHLYAKPGSGGFPSTFFVN